MAALSTKQEYQAIREAIQQLTTLDGNGKRRDKVSVSVEGMSVSYSTNQLQWLTQREKELANRLCNRNRRKRVSPDMSY